MQGCCAHDHDCEDADCGPAWSLHKHIALDKVWFVGCAALIGGWVSVGVGVGSIASGDRGVRQHAGCGAAKLEVRDMNGHEAPPAARSPPYSCTPGVEPGAACGFFFFSLRIRRPYTLPNPATPYASHNPTNHQKQVRCLNEAATGSCRGVFRPWAARLDFGAAPPLESHPGDPELLLHVPFDGQVVLKAICIIGGPLPFLRPAPESWETCLLEKSN